MRDTARTRRVSAAIFAVSLLATACAGSVQDEDDAPPAPGEEAAADDAGEDTADDAGAEEGGDAAAGDIVVTGSSTVEPVTNLVAEAFNAENPDVNISVSGPGTGDGFAAFCNGEAAIQDASRPIADDEIATCEENGIEYTELYIAIDGLSVLTSPENDAVTCLDYNDLYALLGPESTGFANWSDANDLGEELGGANTPYPDAPLQVTAPGEESGTYDSFVELVFEDIAEERGQEPAARPDYTASPNDNVIVDGISGSPTSLGWVGYAFYAENTEALRALEVDGGDGCVAPDEETIASGEYSLARPLFIYVDNGAADENSSVQDFVDFYLGDAGLDAVDGAGYVRVPDEDWAATGEAWSGR